MKFETPSPQQLPFGLRALHTVALVDGALSPEEAAVIAAAQIDKILPQPFERTAVNGFGFVQIIRKRERASLIELLREDPVRAAAMALLRQGERWRSGNAAGGGPVTLSANPSVTGLIHRNRHWVEMLEKRRGGVVTLAADASLSMESFHAG